MSSTKNLLEEHLPAREVHSGWWWQCSFIQQVSMWNHCVFRERCRKKEKTKLSYILTLVTIGSSYFWGDHWFGQENNDIIVLLGKIVFVYERVCFAVRFFTVSLCIMIATHVHLFHWFFFCSHIKKERHDKKIYIS